MQILQTLLEITVYATVIFAVTMSVKRLCKDRLSPLLHYAVWSLFLLRLLLPITFDSPVRLITLRQEAPAAISVQPVDAMNGSPAADAAPYVGATQPEADLQAANAADAPSAPAMAAPAAAARPGLTLAAALVAIWLIGVSMGLIYLIVLYVTLRKRMALCCAKPSKRLAALYDEVRRELGVSKNVPLLCWYGLHSPGILFPNYILMPMAALTAMDDAQVKNALRHELMHYKRGDQTLSILLSVVNAVYWFHPIVWIAVRQIRADMETACDSAVVRRMTAAEKGAYAELILELLSRSGYRQVVLGMAHGRSKAVAEQRIKGVFMNQTSKIGAKAICAALTALVAIGCFTTACVPVTKEAEPVHAVGLDVPAAVSQLSTAGQTAATEPKTTTHNWQQTLSETYGPQSALTVEIDAEITVPTLNEAPLYAARRYDMPNDLALKLVDEFLGEQDVWLLDRTGTKADFAEAKAYIDACRAYETAAGRPDDQYYNDWMKLAADGYAAAPEDVTYAPWDGTFDKHLALMAKINGRLAQFTIDSEDGYTGVSYLADRAIDGCMRASNVYRLMRFGFRPAQTDAERQAVAVADAVLERLGLAEDYAVGGVSGGESVMYYGQSYNLFEVRYVHRVDALNVYPLSSRFGTDNAMQAKGIDLYGEGSAYTSPETMSFVVADGVVAGFEWQLPFALEQTQAERAELLPFARVQELFCNEIFANYCVDDFEKVTLHVDRITLSYLWMPTEGSRRIGTLVPVWDFGGYSTMVLDGVGLEEPIESAADWWQSQSMLTLSAVDGRVINRVNAAYWTE